MVYVVAGATGTVGGGVVRALLEAGEEVRALTRRPERAALPEGVRVFGGDLTRPETLDEVLRGATGVHLVNFGGDDYAPLADGGKLVSAIEAAGVRRVVLLAGWSESTLEPAVRASGLEWTQVAPTEFMANAMEWAEPVRAGRVEEPFPESRTAMVHEADIGAVAAAVLRRGGYHRRVLPLTGPQRLSLREKIATLAEAAGHPVELVELTPDQARQKMREQGVPEEMIEFKLEVFADPPAESNTVNGVVEEVTGRPGRTFAQWAAEHAEAFRS